MDSRFGVGAVLAAFVLIVGTALPESGSDGGMGAGATRPAGFSGGSPPEATAEERELVPRPSRGEFQRTAAEQQERERQAREWRAGDDARSERARSRSAHRGLSRAAAAGLLREEFPGLRNERSRLLEPPPGFELDGYQSDQVARLHSGDGDDRMLAVSNLPLRVKDDTGNASPVDLAFVESLAGFEPRNPLIELSAPRLLAQGIALGRNGFIRMELDGAPPTSAGSLVGNDVFYHDVAEDTDLLFTARPMGFATFTQLRSPASPEQLRYRFTLPNGGQLRATPGGGASIVKDGAELLSILPPDAFDAQGEPVPAAYTVSGGTLELHVSHRDRELAYPIAVDPIGVVPGGSDFWVIENWATDPRSWYHDSTLDRVGWRPHSYWSGDGNDYWGYDWPFAFCSSYCAGHANGLYVEAYHNASYPNYGQGEWFYPTWGDVSIPRAEFAYLWHYADYSFIRASIWSGTQARYTAHRDWHTNPWYESSNYYTAISDSNGWTQGTSASLNLVLLTPPGESWHYRQYGPSSYLGGAIIYLQDRSGPQMTAVSDPPSQWLPAGFTGQITATATDAGLGINGFGLKVPGHADQAALDLSCGDRNQRCPMTRSSASMATVGGQPLAYNTSQMPEGVNTIEVAATDVLGKVSPSMTRSVKVDKSGPTIALSGALYEQREAGPVESSIGPRRLSVSASDAYSGVNSIAVRVDGDFVGGTGDVPCPSGGCTSTYDYDLHAGGFIDGSHDVEVAVQDHVGNRAVTTFQISTVGPEGETFEEIIAQTGANEVDGPADDPAYNPTPLDPEPASVGAEEAALDASPTADAAYRENNCSAENPCGMYQSGRAAAYALSWYDRRNTWYPYFGGNGGDCTNFVSQALRAGGFKFMRWDGHGIRGQGSWWVEKYPDSEALTGPGWTARWEYSTSFVRTRTLYKHLIEYRLGYTVPLGRRLRVGDVVFYNLDGVSEDFNHVQIVSTISAQGRAMVAQHSPGYIDSLADVIERNKKKRGRLGRDWRIVIVRPTYTVADI